MSNQHPEINGARPACFDPEQWRDWVRAEREEALIPGHVASRSGFCEECTARHQASMIAARKCAHPGVKFGPEGGVRPVRVVRKIKAE